MSEFHATVAKGKKKSRQCLRREAIHSRRQVLSARESKFNARASSTWSESVGQRINASSRPVGQIKRERERERESRRLFHGTVQLDRMALITSLEIPRMFGDEKVMLRRKFFEKLSKLNLFGHNGI